MKQCLGWLIRYNWFAIVGFWRIVFASLMGAVRGAMANAKKELAHYDARYREFHVELREKGESWFTR